MAAIEESKSQPVPRPRGVDARPARRAGRGSDLVWNVLTLLVWLGMASLVMAFLSVYINPASPLNPFSPQSPTLAAVIVLPSQTPSPQPSQTAPATETAEPSATPVTPTVTPTEPPVPTETAKIGRAHV